MKYTGKHYLEILKSAKNYNSFIISRLLKVIKKLANNGKLNILDFGSADGFFAQQISELSGNAVGCIEIDSSQLEKCAQKGLKTFLGIDSVPDSEADFIYSLNVLEHIEDDVQTLCTLKDKLKSGGSLCLYLPACSFLYSSMDKRVNHFRRYDKKDIIEKLNKAGFEIESCMFADSLGVAATLIYKLIANKNGDFNKAQVVFYDRLIFPVSKLLDNIIFSRIIGKNIMIKGIKTGV